MIIDGHRLTISDWLAFTILAACFSSLGYYLGDQHGQALGKYSAQLQASEAGAGEFFVSKGQIEFRYFTVITLPFTLPVPPIRPVPPAKPPGKPPGQSPAGSSTTTIFRDKEREMRV